MRKTLPGGFVRLRIILIVCLNTRIHIHFDHLIMSFASMTLNDESDTDGEDELDLSESVASFLAFSMLPEFSATIAFSGNCPHSDSDLDVEWCPQLALNETDFCFGDERLLLVPHCHVMAETLNIQPELSQVMSDSGCPFDDSHFVTSLQLRASGKNDSATGYVATKIGHSKSGDGLESEAHFLLVLGFQGNSTINRILTKARKTFCRASKGEVQLYRTPADTTVKKDPWWDKKYPKAAKKSNALAGASSNNGGTRSKKSSSNSGSSGGGGGGNGHDKDPYSVYRATIDRLIEDKVDDILRYEKPPPRSVDLQVDGSSSSKREQAAEDGGETRDTETSHSGQREGSRGASSEESDDAACGGGGWEVAELCGGDGTLAARLAESMPAPGLRSYTLLERNRALLRVAESKLFPSGSGELALTPGIDASTEKHVLVEDHLGGKPPPPPPPQGTK